MDYSIGSLSDLITGSTTPNKKKVKVVKKQIKSKDLSEATDSSFVSEVSKDEINTVESPIKKKKKIVKTKSEPLSSPQVVVKKLNRKRKLSESNENASTNKKSKNAHNAERRLSVKGKPVKDKPIKDEPEKPEEDPERLARTVFVGNLPITLTKQKLKRLFSKYGKVETVRIRGVPVANPNTSKKVAMIKKEFHPDRKSFYGFVRYEQRDEAIKATEANRMLFQDHHLRVHLCGEKEKLDENKAIFVGNLSFYAEENELWKTFESCGQISSVRIVRDGKTGMGKGFGYVNFQNSDSVTLALEMENIKLKDRELRISICNLNAAKKNNKKNKVIKITKAGKPKSGKKVKVQAQITEGNDVATKTKISNKSFQGTQFMQKKKKKLDKGLLQKKKKVKQIAPQ